MNFRLFHIQWWENMRACGAMLQSKKKKKTKGGISDNFFKTVHSDIFNIQYIAQIDNLLKHFVLQYTAYSAAELWRTVCDYCPASL